MLQYLKLYGTCSLCSSSNSIIRHISKKAMYNKNGIIGKNIVYLQGKCNISQADTLNQCDKRIKEYFQEKDTNNLMISNQIIELIDSVIPGFDQIIKHLCTV